MSMNAFKDLLDALGSRADRISVMASPDDDQTGIVDGSSGTECDKEYWEGTGPAGSTGQAYAALVDILDVLHGRVEDATLDIDGKLKITDIGVSIGDGNPVGGHAIDIYGDSYLDGLLSLTGNLDVDGTAVIDGDVSLGGGFLLQAGRMDVTENAIQSRIGDPRAVMSLDSSGNLLVNIWDSGNDRFAIRADQLALNFGVVSGQPGGPQVLNFYVNDNGGMFLGHGHDIDTIPPLERGINILNGETGDYNYGMKFITPHTTLSGGMTIKSLGKYNLGTGESDPLYEFAIQHLAVPLGGINQTDFIIGGDVTLRLKKDNIQFAGGTLDNNIDFYVRSHIDEGNEYFVRMKPNMAARDERKAADWDVVPAIQFGGAFNDKSARMGFDSFVAGSTFRVFIDNQGNGGILPAVVLGKPLGTAGSPLDLFAVIDDPWLVVVNDNVKDVVTNFPSREGLMIGYGAGALSQGAARIWMRDQSGKRSSIKWGDVEENYYTYVKDGVLMTLAGSDNIEVAGTGGHAGAHLIPTMSCADSFIDLTDIAQYVESQTTLTTGSIVLVRSTSDNTAKLLARSPDGKWYSFASDGNVAT